jgi:hypothetical protein
MGGGNSHNDDDEPKGNSALDIHLNLHVMVYISRRGFGGINTQGAKSNCP